jgi:Fe2+ or Zn2+ uptake regulation protein
VLFDSRTDDHDHLVCRRCGAVADLETDTDRGAMFEVAASLGFQADDAQVVITGLCADCAAAQAAHAGEN